MAFINTSPLWTSNRKRMTFALPFIIAFFSFMFAFILTYAKGSDKLEMLIWFSILTMMCIFAGVYTLFKDCWQINLPFNHDLIDKINDEIEIILKENNINYIEKEALSLKLNPYIKGKCFEVITDVGNFAITTGIMSGTSEQPGESKLYITSVSKNTLDVALTLRDLITSMLHKIDYKSYGTK
jgi:hypothetical protein